MPEAFYLHVSIQNTTEEVNQSHTRICNVVIWLLEYGSYNPSKTDSSHVTTPLTYFPSHRISIWVWTGYSIGLRQQAKIQKWKFIKYSANFPFYLPYTLLNIRSGSLNGLGNQSLFTTHAYFNTSNCGFKQQLH